MYVEHNKFEITIIGGGPAGSTAAVFLSEIGFDVCLVEKRKFPREVLCGEFLSKEVIEIIKELNLYNEFLSLNPNYLKIFKLINDDGKEISSDLNFPAYGLKRSTFDNFLLNKVKKEKIHIYQPCRVNEILFNDNEYKLICSNQNSEQIEITSKNVIAAYGRQNILDKKLNRNFVNTKSHLNGVKFHLEKKYFKEFKKDEIKIFSGKDIYCGLNEVNDNIITVCFLENRKSNNLSPRENLIQFISESVNFKEIFDSDFEKSLLNSPIYGAGNIYFGKRKLVENGIYMLGDAARVIAPLVGDGIGMALQSAKLIANIFEKIKKNKISLSESYEFYHIRWNELFAKRIRTAALIQKLILMNYSRNLSIQLTKTFPQILSHLIQATRS